MKKARSAYNPKRRIAPLEHFSADERTEMARKAIYEGNPQHKLRPNDYGLVPSHAPRPGKTLCDGAGEFPKARAVEILKSGFSRGMVRLDATGPWPKNVWSVFDGEPFEAQLTNRDQGTYHGYPMPADDEFRKEVLKEWDRRE